MNALWPQHFLTTADHAYSYDTLCGAHTDLTSRQNETDSLAEAKRAEFAALKKQKMNEILAANNQIAEMKTKLDEAQEATSSLQTNADLILGAATRRTSQLGQVLMSIKNLVQRCTAKRQGQRVLNHTEESAGGGSLEPVEEHKESGGSARGHSSAAELTEELDSLSTAELRAKQHEASQDLNIIGAYIVDFMAIVQKGHAEADSAWPSQQPPPVSARSTGHGGGTDRLAQPAKLVKPVKTGRGSDRTSGRTGKSTGGGSAASGGNTGGAYTSTANSSISGSQSTTR